MHTGQLPYPDTYYFSRSSLSSTATRLFCRNNLISTCVNHHAYCIENFMEAKWSSATPQSSDLGSRPCLGKPRLLPSKGSFELSSTDLPLIEGATELQCASGCTTLIPGRSQTVWVHCCCWAGRRTGPVALGRFEGSAGLERAWNRAVFYSRSVSQLEIGLYYYCHWLLVGSFKFKLTLFQLFSSFSLIKS